MPSTLSSPWIKCFTPPNAMAAIGLSSGRALNRRAVRATHSFFTSSRTRARQAALVRTLWMTLRIGGRNKHHRATLDERPIFLGECGTHRDLFQTIGQRPGFADILKAAHAFVVHALIGHNGLRMCCRISAL